jgi:hypothetical protein
MPLRKYATPEEARQVRLQQMKAVNDNYQRTDEQRAADNKAKRERYASDPDYKARKLAAVRARRAKAKQPE